MKGAVKAYTCAEGACVEWESLRGVLEEVERAASLRASRRLKRARRASRRRRRAARTEKRGAEPL